MHYMLQQDYQKKGILRLKEGKSYGALKQGFLYNETTAREMIKKNIDYEINKQIEKYN